MSDLASRDTIVAGTLLLLAVTGVVFFFGGRRSPAPIKVGIVHSETGTKAISKKFVRDATLLAIEEINERGELLADTSRRSSSMAHRTRRPSLNPLQPSALGGPDGMG